MNRAMIFFITFVSTSLVIIPIIWIINKIDKGYFNKTKLYTSDRFVFRLPHIAFVVDGTSLWAKKNKSSLQDAYFIAGKKFFDCIELCLNEGVPEATFHIMGMSDFLSMTQEHLIALIDGIFLFFEQRKQWFFDKKILVNVVGNTFLLPEIAREKIQRIMSHASLAPQMKLNILFLYDPIDDIGHGIDRLVLLGKGYTHGLTEETLIASLQSGSIGPIDVMVRTGKSEKLGGILPLQSMYAQIFLFDYLWPDIPLEKVQQIIRVFQVYGSHMVTA